MIEVLKKISNSILSFIESVGRARAAAELARHGHHRAAQRLINGETII